MHTDPYKRQWSGGEHLAPPSWASPYTEQQHGGYDTRDAAPVMPAYGAPSRRGRHGLMTDTLSSAPVQRTEDEENYRQAWSNSMVEKLNIFIRNEMISKGVLLCMDDEMRRESEECLVELGGRWCTKGWMPSPAPGY